MAIEDAILGIRERIEGACNRSGRSAAEVRLMGVSKFHSRQAVEAAWRGGIRLFGESRLQEAKEKFTDFAHPEAELHMIGPLQRNKVRAAASLFDCIQSVDRDELIGELGKIPGRDSPLALLLEFHTGEESKTGFPDLDSLYAATERILSLPNLTIRGLMTMAPYTDDQALIRRSFRSLAAARDKLSARFPPEPSRCEWSCLSMGMSNDFEIAIEEGATLVRIGTAIFGERQP